jgi:hypothetical protein
MYLKKVILVLSMVVLLSVHAVADAAITVVSEPDVSPTAVVDLQKTAEAFDAVLKDTFKSALDVDVKIIACTDSQSVASVFEREMQQELSLKDSKSGYMWGSLKRQIIIVNVKKGEMKEPWERVETLAMFLVRQWQWELRGKKAPNDINVETKGSLEGLFWFDQGVADYLGAVIAEKRGLRSIDKWRTERIEYLNHFYSKQLMKPQEIQILAVRSWSMFILENPVYKADLLTASFLEQDTSKKLGLIPGFYLKSANTEDAVGLWSSTFEMDYMPFCGNFVNWYNNTICKNLER